MKINIIKRDEVDKARGFCVVIDVLRAFTTAAYAFNSGAKDICLVATPEEALLKYKEDSSLILMGEKHGRKIENFHFGNSPSNIEKVCLKDKRLVQRTSSGTQGVVGCKNASRIMIASFVVAEATLKHILEVDPSEITFVVTGMRNGDEDLSLAEYLTARLLKQKVSINKYLERVTNSPVAQLYFKPDETRFNKQDLDLAIEVDKFSFAMEVFKQGGDLIAKKIMY